MGPALVFRLQMWSEGLSLQTGHVMPARLGPEALGTFAGEQMELRELEALVCTALLAGGKLGPRFPIFILPPPLASPHPHRLR